jgi:hypothetical protein
MTKLQIEGKYCSYSILEFKKEDALFLQAIMEKELVSYDKIFFERLDFKKLGYKKLKDIPVVAQFSGFHSNEKFMALKPVGIFTLFWNRKKVFVSALDRLEERYQKGLFKEFCELQSTISSYELAYKKRRGYKYFFLKDEQSGKFNYEFEGEVALNQLLFQNTNLHSLKLNLWTKQFVNVIYRDSKLEFTVGKNSELKQHIEAFGKFGFEK